MSGQDDARALLDAFADFADPATGAEPIPSQDRPPRLATVDPAYSGSGAAKVTFDGEALLTAKSYPTLTRLRASDRVVMLPIGRSYVILGAVGAADPTPVGTYIDGAWTAAPPGYLLCDGTVYLRATYAALFAVIGTTYNTGGETGSQFRVPDFRGRTKVTKSASGTFQTLGGTMGAETHTLALSEAPSHYHRLGPSSALDGSPDVFMVQETSGSTYPGWAFTVAGTGGGIRAVITDQQGGGGAHNNIQPSRVVNTAIRF